MTQLTDPPHEPDPGKIPAWLDEIADRFESEWRDGSGSSVTEYLEGYQGEDRRRLALELVHLELELAHQSGTLPDLSELAHRIPEILDAHGDIESSLVEHRAALSAGTSPLDTQGSGTLNAAQGTLGPVPPSEVPTSPAPLSGRRLGRFELVEAIGAGAFSTVYRARDTVLQREVAIKIPRGELLASSDQRARFLREARSAARLAHPGIVPLYEVNADENQPFLVSELIKGLTLAKQLSERRLTSHESAQLIAQTADALQCAHDQGVVHRDVKPSNILIDEKGAPRLADFGLAQLAEGVAALTRDGEIVGTPAYMSPEQASAAPGGVGSRSDVYSLGVVLYELLTGQLPFQGNLHQVLRQIADQEPLPPRKVNRRLPVDLETICLKAMEKSPDRRYASARALAEDLRRFLHDEPVLARRLAPMGRALRSCRKHPWIAAAAVMMLGAAGYEGITWWRMPGRIELSVSPPGAQVDVAGQQATAANGSISLTVPRGEHILRIRATDHADFEERIVVGRQVVPSRHIALRHDMGRVDIEADGKGSEIFLGPVSKAPAGGKLTAGTLDAAPHYGSRLQGEFPTGEYLAQARGERCIDSPIRRVSLRRQGAERLRLSLEEAVVWEHLSANIQGGVFLIPDVDGDGREDVLHNETGRNIVFSSADGREIESLPVDEGNAVALTELQLGGALGKVLIGAIQRQTASERPGVIEFMVRCRRNGHVEFLNWKSEPRSFAYSSGLESFRVKDLTRDGIDEIGCFSRDGHVYVVNLGVEPSPVLLHEYSVAKGPLTKPPAVASVDGRRLVFLMEGAEVELPSKTSDQLLGSLDLATGQTVWSEEFAGVRQALLAEVNDDQVPDALFLQGDRWKIISGATGKVIHDGDLPMPAGEVLQAGFVRLDKSGERLLVLGCGPEKNVIAIQLSDDGVAWRYSASGAALLWTVERGYCLTSPRGELLLRGTAELVAIDCRTGERTWSSPGFSTGVVRGDWDADGLDEIFTYVRQSGLVCLAANGQERWRIRCQFDLEPQKVIPDGDGDGLGEIVVLAPGSYLGAFRGPRRIWRQTANGPLLAPAVVSQANGRATRVFQVGNWGSRQTLMGFEAATGLRLLGGDGDTSWLQVPLNLPPNYPPALTSPKGLPARLFVVGSRFDKRGSEGLYEIDAESGRIAKCYPLKPNTTSYCTPAVGDITGDNVADLVCLSNEPKEVRAIDGATGKCWVFTTGAENRGKSILLDVDRDGVLDVLAASDDGNLYALHGKTGNALWRYTAGEQCRAPPSLHVDSANGSATAYLVDSAGQLAAIDAYSGRQLWKTERVDGAEPLATTPATAKVQDRLMVVAARGRAGVEAYDAQTGTRIWCWDSAESAVLASPVAADLDHDGQMEVIVTTTDGRLAALDAVSGRLFWQVRSAGHKIVAAPTIADLDWDGVDDILVADYLFQLTAWNGSALAAGRRRTVTVQPTNR